MKRKKSILRAIALTLALFLAFGAILPLAVQYSEAHNKHHKHKKHKKIKKYSRKWWKLYRAKMRKKRALEARKRALRLRHIKLLQTRRAEQAAKKNSDTPMDEAKAVSPDLKAAKAVKSDAKPEKPGKSGKARTRVAAGEDNSQASSPFGAETPKGWTYSKTDSQFRVNDTDGRPIGSAAISVVGPAIAQTEEANSAKSRSKSVGGIPTSALRRTVIDKMLKEDGWIVNDYQKDINGRKVFVVVAQAPGANGAVQSRIFYFTEVDGKIYSVATNAPTDRSERIAQDSEKVLNLLLKTAHPVQSALNK